MGQPIRVLLDYMRSTETDQGTVHGYVERCEEFAPIIGAVSLTNEQYLRLDEPGAIQATIERVL